ncbi:serine protease 3-like [Drosophila tropicalis]|uniref:serine protease 3-like n=1 Tax=Drosophila tropicalis TaxID=46794 RepID=UPI0035ABFE5F
MESILFCFLGSLLLLQALEVRSKSMERIVNGQQAKEGQFPYIVALSIETKEAFRSCGGSIIANDWILTAAHCTENAQRVIIYYGSIEKAKAQVVVEVQASNIIQHPKYDSTLVRNDIALIHSKWVDFNDRIQSIALPRPEQVGESFEGQWSQAAGWGSTYNYNIVLIPETLQWTNLEITPKFLCEVAYSYVSNITENVLCAGSPYQQSICAGDSGGPLVLIKEKILVGVSTAVHPKGCRIGFPALFNRVSKYLDWIRQNSNVTS